MTRDRYDELADELFAAARRERASASARERTLLGQVTPTSTLTRGSVLRGQLHGWFESRRVRALGALALAACFAAALVLWRRQSPQLPRISAETPASGVSQRRAASSPVSPLAASEAGERPASSADSVRPSVPVLPSTRSVKPAPVTLERELGLLDRARAQAAAGNSRAALSLLDEYEKLGKQGSLTAEARLLRVQVLAKAGDSARAARLARQFIDDYPDSPLTDRARTYLERASEDQDPAAPTGVRP